MPRVQAHVAIRLSRCGAATMSALNLAIAVVAAAYALYRLYRVAKLAHDCAAVCDAVTRGDITVADARRRLRL